MPVIWQITSLFSVTFGARSTSRWHRLRLFHHLIIAILTPAPSVGRLDCTSISFRLAKPERSDILWPVNTAVLLFAIIIIQMGFLRLKLIDWCSCVSTRAHWLFRFHFKRSCLSPRVVLSYTENEYAGEQWSGRICTADGSWQGCFQGFQYLLGRWCCMTNLSKI